MNKWAKIDFDRCDPTVCDEATGKCASVAACRRKLLEQEEEFDSPMLLSNTHCVGCGDCVSVCPLKAIEITHG